MKQMMRISPNVKDAIKTYKGGKHRNAFALCDAILQTCDGIHPVEELSSIVDVKQLRLKLEAIAKNETRELDLEEIVRNSLQDAKDASAYILSADFLLVALLKKHHQMFDGVLREFSLSTQDVLGQLNKNATIDGPSIVIASEQKEEGDQRVKQKEGVTPNAPTVAVLKKTALLRFGADLTERASCGLVGPLSGREQHLTRLEEILLRKKRNNPIILGEAGVGKTSLVELLALRIASTTCNDLLVGKRIWQVDIGALFSGTKLRGEFEGRVKAILDEAASDPSIILFIDEIHMICGGSDDPSSSLANIIKPYISDGKVTCIGTTTFRDYKRTIEKDTALARRFESLTLPEPDKQETLAMMKHALPAYQAYHMVKYSDALLKSLVDFADKYIKNKNFPDKGLEVMDALGAYVKRLKIRKSLGVVVAEEDLKFFCHNNKITESTPQLTAMLKNYAHELSVWHEALKATRIPITLSHLKSFFNERYNVPIGVMEVGAGKFNLLAESIKKQIYGQEECVDKVCAQIAAAEIGVKDQQKPLASFIFCGSSGVGKTELAKQLSKNYFGNSNVVMFNMSEFKDKISANKLVGSSPGYVGYDEGGRLVNELVKNPRSVVLFDEIEKAHPDVLDLLLQVLDEGQITDGLGRIAYFSKAVVILTTNIKPTKSNGMIGFGQSSEHQPSVDFHGPLKDAFKQEMLNRLDEIIVFNDLSPEVEQLIFKKEIKIITERFADKGITLSVSDDVMGSVLNDGSDYQDGARRIKNSINAHIVKPTLSAIVGKPKVKTVEVVKKEGKIIVEVD
jgi:ATP-dependent Clp protease ATP-binding subunit ClpC